MPTTPFRVRHGIVIESTANTAPIAANNQVLTGSANTSLVDLATTWNTTGNPTAIKLNVTNTASGASSALMDLQVGGSSFFKIDKTGNISIKQDAGAYEGMIINQSYDTTSFGATTGSFRRFIFSTAIAFGVNNINTQMRGDSLLGWTTSTNALGTYDVVLARDISIANTSFTGLLGQRNGVNPQTYRLYGTYTDASNYERLSLSANSSGHYIIGEEGGTGSARPLYLGANNATAVTIDTAGRVGIGTTSPSYKFDINGSFNVLGTSIFRNLPGFSDHTITIRANDVQGGGHLLRFLDNAGNLLSGVDSTGSAFFLSNTKISFSNGSIGNPLSIITGNPGGLGIQSTTSISFATGGTTERVRIDTAGNVGIGTTTPASRLHVASSNNSTLSAPTETSIIGPSYSSSLIIQQLANAANTFSAISFYNTFDIQASIGATYVGAGYGAGGNLFFNTRAPGGGETLSEKMRITSAGFVGIGNTAPISRLTVDTGISVTQSGGGPYVELFRSGQSHWKLQHLGNGFGIQNSWGGGTYRNAVVIEDGLGISTQELLRLAYSGGLYYVGIGISAPTAKLTVASGTSPTSQHIYGTYTDASNYERLSLSANANGSFIQTQQAGTGSARPLYLGANNATAVTIDTAGRVGIGTTSPGVKLDVNGAGSFSQYVRSLYLNTYDNSKSIIGNPLNYTIIFDGNGNESIRILSNGNVGIGNTAPGHKLSVNGSIYMTPSDSNRIWSGTDNLRLGFYPQLAVSDTLSIFGPQQSIQFGGTGFYATIGSNVPWDFARGVTPQGIRIHGTYTDVSNYERINLTANSSGHYIIGQQAGTGSARPLYLGSNNVTRMTITDDGNVGIGTTSPSQKLHISGGHALIGGTYGLYFNDGSTARIVYDQGQYRIHGIGSTIPIVFLTNSIERMLISNTGNVGIGTTTPTSKLDVNSDSICVRTAKTPASNTATGNQGDICWDENYIYICTATNTWKRSSISTW